MLHLYEFDVGVQTAWLIERHEATWDSGFGDEAARSHTTGMSRHRTLGPCHIQSMSYMWLRFLWTNCVKAECRCSA